MSSAAQGVAIGIVAAITLSSAGAGAGEWYANRYMPGAGLDGVVPLALGWLAGLFAGIAIGVWWAARSAGARRPTRAGMATFALLPIALVVSVMVTTELGVIWWPIGVPMLIATVALGRQMGRGNRSPRPPAPPPVT